MEDLEFKAKSSSELIMIKGNSQYSFQVQILPYGSKEKLKQAYKELREKNSKNN